MDAFEGDTVELDKVLLLADDDKVTVALQCLALMAASDTKLDCEWRLLASLVRAGESGTAEETLQAWSAFSGHIDGRLAETRDQIRAMHEAGDSLPEEAERVES